MVTDFLTPSIESNYTYPPDLKEEIARLPVGGGNGGVLGTEDLV